MKQTFVSDVLEIPETIERTPNEKTSNKTQKANKTATKTAAIKATKAPASRVEFDEEENEEGEGDDWENMFDETGDCLDPKIMQELAAAVGRVRIELPKMDYSVSSLSQN